MSRLALAATALATVWFFTPFLAVSAPASTGPAGPDASDSKVLDDDDSPSNQPAPRPAPAAQAPVIQWHCDYAKASALAKAEKKMLLIVFYATGRDRCRDCFLCQSVPQALAERPERAERYVWLMQPLNAAAKIDGKLTRLLSHPSFAHMHQQQGIAIVDYENPDTPHYGYVVSQFPFLRGRYYTSFALGTILDLPPGTLTQRTMIYAVRTHRERPRSTEGYFSPVLAEEAERHSLRQAQMRVQGHHSWESRFHQINARLGQGMRATEVVAESWPGETLVEAAEECVRSWRQSSGHWSAVSRPHRAWAYDMKRGQNGIWYGTGIFGR